MSTCLQGLIRGGRQETSKEGASLSRAAPSHAMPARRERRWSGRRETFAVHSWRIGMTARGRDSSSVSSAAAAVDKLLQGIVIRSINLSGGAVFQLDWQHRVHELLVMGARNSLCASNS
ncbi:unnamed protein product [Calypogeia fissa]